MWSLIYKFALAHHNNKAVDNDRSSKNGKDEEPRRVKILLSSKQTEKYTKVAAEIKTALYNRSSSSYLSAKKVPFLNIHDAQQYTDW